MRVRAFPGRGSAKPHPDKVFRRLNAFLFVVAILIYSIGLVAWRCGKPGVLFLDQSDTVTPFMIMRDFLRDPSSFLDWHKSPALYAFPDCLLAGLLLLLPVDIRLLPMLYGGIMVAGYAFACAAVLSVYGRIHWMSATLIATAMLTLLLIGYCPPAMFTSIIASYSIAPFFHTGALVAGFLLIAGLGVVVRPARKPAHLLVALIILAFLVSHSDAIYLPWFVLPASLAAAVYLALTRTTVPAAVALLVAAAVAGLTLDELTHYVPFGADPSDYAATFRTAVQLVQQSIQSFDVALTAALALAPLLLGRGVFLLVKGARKRRFDTGDLGELLIVSCFFAALATPLVSGKLFAVDRLRYSLPIFLLPYLWITLVLVRTTPGFLRPTLPATSALLMAFIAFRYSPAAIAGTHHFASYRQPAACLVENGLSEGYANYWASKSVMWNSAYRLHVFSLRPMGDVVPLRVAYNERWFRRNAVTGAPIRPNFVIVFGLDEGKVLAKFGPPSRKIMCGIYPIWIYDQTLPLLD
jgi:hypothetical protein